MRKKVFDMLNRIDADSREDVFLPLSRRKTKGVYFLRLSCFSSSLKEYIWRYHEAARQRGAIIENQIGNPDDRQLSYYNDVLGAAFEPTEAFVSAATHILFCSISTPEGLLKDVSRRRKCSPLLSLISIFVRKSEVSATAPFEQTWRQVARLMSGMPTPSTGTRQRTRTW